MVEGGSEKFGLDNKFIVKNLQNAFLAQPYIHGFSVTIYTPTDALFGLNYTVFKVLESVLWYLCFLIFFRDYDEIIQEVNYYVKTNRVGCFFQIPMMNRYRSNGFKRCFLTKNLIFITIIKKIEAHK